MEIWRQVVNLPSPALGILALIALGAWGVHGWNFCRLIRVRADIRESLERQGFAVRKLELRWLTRGSFPDLRLPGLRGSRGQYLYHVAAADGGGRPRTGWVRWSAGWPWRPAAPWSLRWDDTASAGRKGLSTAAFLAMLVAVASIVLVLIGRIWQLS